MPRIKQNDPIHNLTVLALATTKTLCLELLATAEMLADAYDGQEDAAEAYGVGDRIRHVIGLARRYGIPIKSYTLQVWSKRKPKTPGKTRAIRTASR